MVRKLEVKSNLEKIIEKGGDVAADKVKVKKEFHIFNFRIPLILSEKIDESMQTKLGISKTAWILQAIQEKLKRDND